MAKKKGITRAALEYSARTVDNLPEDDISRLELRRMLVHAYQAGYAYRREAKKEILTEGIWVAITYFAAHRESHQLLVEVIRALGLKYDECIKLMNDISYNRDIIEPYVNEVFGIDGE